MTKENFVLKLQSFFSFPLSYIFWKEDKINHQKETDVCFWIKEWKESTKGIYIGEDNGFEKWLFKTSGVGVIRADKGYQDSHSNFENQIMEIQNTLQKLSFVQLIQLEEKSYDEDTESFYQCVLFQFECIEVREVENASLFK